jgi:hypothetical protein
MTIHAFVLLSTHAHFLLSPASAGQLALFMQFVNANVAKEAGRLHFSRERLWSCRYRSIAVAAWPQLHRCPHHRCAPPRHMVRPQQRVPRPPAWPRVGASDLMEGSLSSSMTSHSQHSLGRARMRRRLRT